MKTLAPVFQPEMMEMNEHQLKSAIYEMGLAFIQYVLPADCFVVRTGPNSCFEISGPGVMKVSKYDSPMGCQVCWLEDLKDRGFFV
jgi:hypothetical protein